MLKQKLLEMLGGKKTGPLTRQKGQATEMRACWELQARGERSPVLAKLREALLVWCGALEVNTAKY